MQNQAQYWNVETSHSATLNGGTSPSGALKNLTLNKATSNSLVSK